MSTEVMSRVREYPLAIGAMVIVVVVGVLLFLRADRIQTLEADLSTAQSSITRMENNLREALDLADDQERLGVLRERINDRLMVREEVAFNLDYFYRLEASHDVGIEALRPLGGIAGPAGVVPSLDLFDVLGFDITVRGDFGKVIEFIRILESDQYFGRVETVTMTRPTGSGANVVVVQIALNLLGKKP